MERIVKFTQKVMKDIILEKVIRLNYNVYCVNMIKSMAKSMTSQKKFNQRGTTRIPMNKKAAKLNTEKIIKLNTVEIIKYIPS